MRDDAAAQHPGRTPLPGRRGRRAQRGRGLVSWRGFVALAVILAAGVSAGTWLALRPAASATLPYRLVAVVRTTLSQSVTVTGTIEPKATSTLSFTAQGTVTAVDVAAGQQVTAGQVLATMSSPDAQEQASQADATVAQDEATLSGDKSGGASSAQVTADQAQVASDQSQAGAAAAAVAGLTLRAPAAGIVTTVGYKTGQQLAGSGGTSPSAGGAAPGGGSSGSAGAAPSITVVSADDVVDASVNSAGVGKVKAGDRAVIAEAGGGTATGTLASVSAVADTSTGVPGFPVVVDVTGTPRLFAGASATVQIISGQAASALAVPTAALRTGPGGRTTVRVMSRGRPVTRAVTTGITSGGLTQVTSGLSAGEQVVVDVVRTAASPAPGQPGPPGTLPGPGGLRIAPVFPGGG